ncbi:2-isopropylmalate synthase [Williamsia muralis]|uniref:2-isopropylmalate synthase n=1 Tax=Williamsia marianensis TaxID=85044 RepID=UPI003F1569D6
MNTLTTPDTPISPRSKATAPDPFASRYGRSLPSPLRAEAAGMTWTAFADTYAPTTGPIRLGNWTASAAPQDLLHCRATIATGDVIRSLSATATGPISALTDMLYRLGAGVEIVSLHQYDFAGGVATFLLCERDDRRTWAMGNGRTGQESALSALIAAANRLY